LSEEEKWLITAKKSDCHAFVKAAASSGRPPGAGGRFGSLAFRIMERAGPAWSRSSDFFPPTSFFPADAVAPADYSPQDTPGGGKIQD
jgi:hypothetical protein